MCGIAPIGIELSTKKQLHEKVASDTMISRIQSCHVF